MNSLEKRIERHLKDEKKKHWHIDYLLDMTKVENVIFGESEKRKECDIAKKLSNEFSSVQNFGCSDCKCDSHLFYHEKISKLKQETIQIFKKINLEPEMWKNGE